MMPDTRKHRGPHPQDAELFAETEWPKLQSSVEHVSWLMTRGYAVPSALKLVGDRFALAERQRRAVLRSSCSDDAVTNRQQKQISASDLADVDLEIDGFNLLTTIEAACAGSVLLLGRDGCLRDMASMHGNYRKVAETIPAADMIGRFLESAKINAVTWYLDSPVSNSGRLKTALQEVAEQHRWNWAIELVPDPDAILKQSQNVAVSADSAILDACKKWTNLAWDVIRQEMPGVRMVPLQGEEKSALPGENSQQDGSHS